MKNFLLIFVITALLASCAQFRPGLRVNTFGEVDPLGDEEIAKQAEVERTIPKIRVLSGKIPKGLDITGNKIIVLDGFENTYEVLGTIEADYLKDKDTAFKNMYWTWTDYDQTWRKILCYPQAPLKAITLGMWSVFIPTAYPCVKSAPSDEVERRTQMIEEMKKGADAMGGNLMIIISNSDIQTTTIDTSSGSTSTNIINSVSSKAFVIIEKQ